MERWHDRSNGWIDARGHAGGTGRARHVPLSRGHARVAASATRLRPASVTSHGFASGRRTRRGSRSSATSTAGMPARHALTGRADELRHLGRAVARRRARRRPTSTASSRATATRSTRPIRSRSTPKSRRDRVARRGASTTTGATRRGWRARDARNALDAPMSIYEVHLGSWRRGERALLPTYREHRAAARRLRARAWASRTSSSCR